jgi:hypothetical protein
MKSTRLCTAAATAASEDPALAGIGFDPISVIISLLLPVIQNLFKGCFPADNHPTPATTKEELAQSYHGESSPGANDGEYDRSVAAPVARHAKHIAHSKHQNITKDQARAIAIHTLDNVRLGGDDVVQEAMSASA